MEDQSPEEWLRSTGATQETFEPKDHAKRKQGDGKAWLPPLPIVSSLPPVQRLTPDMLPGVLHYVFDIAERQQSPADFSAVCTLCGLAAVIGGRIRIAPKQKDNWRVVPNLWGGIIGRPSAMKSPAMQAALEPVYKLQSAMREGWEADMRAARLEESLTALDAKDARKRAEKALKSGDRDAARSILESAEPKDAGEEPCPRLIVNDATVEKLGELLNENPRGLLLVRDELPGFLAKMESEECASDRAFYLEAFNGDGRFTYDRIGRGTVHIDNCTLSLIGGIQPSRIVPIVRGAVTGATNDGLIQRLQLAVWPDDATEWRFVDRNPSGPLWEAYEAVFRDVQDNLPGTPDEPHVMRFTGEAQALFSNWYTALHQEARAGDLPSVLESHLLKMPKTVASLALIFELVDGGREAVGVEATQRALRWASYLRSHADRLYASGKTMVEEGAKLIVERRHKLPAPFTARNVHQKAWANLTEARVVAEAIDVLVDANLCREAVRPQGAGGGRPTQQFEWNPALPDQNA